MTGCEDTDGQKKNQRVHRDSRASSRDQYLLRRAIEHIELVCVSTLTVKLLNLAVSVQGCTHNHFMQKCVCCCFCGTVAGGVTAAGAWCV